MADEERATVVVATVWGQLLCTTEAKSPIRLGKKTIRIGRTSDCDIRFPTNKLISGKHCDIFQDADGKIWLADTSTNGTLVNGKKVKKGEKVQISHNDQIHLVHRKNQPGDDIAYIFQDLKCLELEEELSLLDSTQEYIVDDAIKMPTEKEQSVKSGERPVVEVSDEMQPECKKPKQGAEAERKRDAVTTNQKTKSHSHDTMGEALVCGICQDIFHDCISLQPCMHSFCASCYSQWMDRSKDCPTCRLPVERMSRNHIVNNLVEAYLIENPGKRRSAEELAEMDARNHITEDMVKPKKKNVREMFEEDTDSELDTGDSDEDTSENEEEDAAYNLELESPFGSSSFGSLFGFTSNILSTMYANEQLLQAQTVSAHVEDMLSTVQSQTATPGDEIWSAVTITSRESRPPAATCRWCPGFRATTVVSTSCNRATAAASDSLSTRASSQENSSGVASEVPHPVCPERMVVHLMCMCCMKPMPKQEDLPLPHAGFTYAKSQKCGICAHFFCHLLWKCDKTGCLGCLNEFQDLDFNDNCLMDTLILNNKYESQVLKNYLNEKGWSPKELLSKCLEKLDKKEYSTPDCVTKPDLDSKYILCHRCGLNNFKNLAYQFRRDIPKEDLPAAVTSRPDCHWGRNCRTQINRSNPHHASRYNHICEQTRFR